MVTYLALIGTHVIDSFRHISLTIATESTEIKKKLFLSKRGLGGFNLQIC